MNDSCNDFISKHKKSSDSMIFDSQCLNTKSWKVGITTLEFLQNKNKFEDCENIISVLFEILRKCLGFEEQSPLEYAIQLILSCILQCSTKIASISKSVHKSSLEKTVSVDLIVQCIRNTENPQTQHHALVLLSHLATVIPQQVLHNMMNIFTFMGSAFIRRDDAYSLQIITNIIESVEPAIIATEGSDKQSELEDRLVIPVLKVFSAIIVDVPEHRRLMLYTKLLQILDPKKYLWMFLCIVFESHVLCSEKKNQQKLLEIEELPKRIVISLQLVKSFEPDVALGACTSLLDYIKTLPEETVNVAGSTDVDLADSLLFDLNNRTSTQLRHFKYIILQFVLSITSSVEFVNKASIMSAEEAKLMKTYYKDFIIKILSYIPIVTISAERNQTTNQFKYWKVLLRHCYDILDNSISLLSPDMLLIVVYGLLSILEQ